jgi:hypothetical protein
LMIVGHADISSQLKFCRTKMQAMPSSCIHSILYP